jgi:hypothetical protein
MGRCIAIETARARHPVRPDLTPRARFRDVQEMPRMRLRREQPAIWWSLTAWLWDAIKRKSPAKARGR